MLKTTDYSEGLVYENGVLSNFPTPEGRVRFAGGNYVSEYTITDQQVKNTSDKNMSNLQKLFRKIVIMRTAW